MTDELELEISDLIVYERDQGTSANQIHQLKQNDKKGLDTFCLGC